MRLGLPKALAKRSSQRAASEMLLPEDVPIPKTTASGPYLAFTYEQARAVNSIASSQEIGAQPGSESPFGSSALHRRAEAIRGINDLWGGGSLDADTAVRMRGVGIDFGQSPVLDSRHDAASGNTHGAVGVKLLGSP